MNVRVKTLLASAALLAGGIIVSSTGLSAQTGGLKTPLGTPSACGVTSTVNITSTTIPSGKFTATGTANFITTAYSAAPEATAQQGTSFTATGSSTTLGQATWSFSGTSNSAFISANQTTSSFPATSTLSFNVEATFSAVPGRTFRSIGPVTLKTSNLRSFNPQVNESYALTNTNLQFEDVAQPGVPVFTIPTMSVVISVNDSSL